MYCLAITAIYTIGLTTLYNAFRTSVKSVIIASTASVDEKFTLIRTSIVEELAEESFARARLWWKVAHLLGIQATNKIRSTRRVDTEKWLGVTDGPLWAHWAGIRVPAGDGHRTRGNETGIHSCFTDFTLGANVTRICGLHSYVNWRSDHFIVAMYTSKIRCNSGLSWYMYYVVGM